MTFALLGNIITQSGGSLSSFDDPSTLSAWAAANGLSASVFLTGRQLTIQGGYKLIVNGYYIDTGYTYYYGAGSRPYLGPSGYWMSGEQALQSVATAPSFRGIAIKGAKWIVTSWTSDESFNTGATGTLRWYGVDINTDVTLPVTGQSRADFIATSASLDVQMIDCSITPRGNHRIMGGPNVKATGCDFGFGPFYFTGDLSGFSNNTVGHYLATEVRCNIDNGRTLTGATLKFPLATTNWVINLGAVTDVRAYRDLGLPSTLNYAGVLGYQGGTVKLPRGVSLPVVAAESTGTSVDTATVYRQELGAWVAYPVASFPETLDAYVWKWTDANFAFRVAHVTEDRRLCDFRVVDYARQVATGQIDISNAPYTGKVFMPLDALITEVNQATVAAYTAADSAAKAYDMAKLWMINNYSGQTAPSLSRNGTTITASKNVVLAPDAESAYAETATTITLKAGIFSGSIVTTGSVSGTGTVTGSIEDSTGVRVTVTKSGGGAFNIAARRGTTGAYTYLGYQSGVSTVTYTVPKGTPVEVVAWALGHVTYTRLIDTSAGGVALAMEMTLNPAINTTLDVSNYLANITTTLDTSGADPVFKVTPNAPMTVPDIEVMKALVHQLVSSEVALSAGFPPGSVSLLVINADEITVMKPAIQIPVGDSVPVDGRIYLDSYFNRAPALAINPAWELAPVRADGNQVQILRTKPSLDPGYLAAKVVAAMPVTDLTPVLDAVATRASQTSVSAIPTNPLLATDARLGNLDAAVSTRLAANAYTAPSAAPTPAQNAAAVRTELAAELGRVDVAVSTRLASTGYTAPDNAGVAAIKAKTDTLVNTDLSGVMTALGNKPTLAQIEASTVIAKKADLPAAPDNAGIAAIKAKTDSLANADLSGLATQTDVATAASGVVTAVNAVAATVNTVAADVADLQGLV